MKKFSGRPSPGAVIAVVALAFAIVGTAVAADDLGKANLTKSKVKRIAKTQAAKQLRANIDRSHVNRADTAGTANTANMANTAESAKVADNAEELDGEPASAYAKVSNEAFREVGDSGEPAFENGFTNFGAEFATAAFFKDAFGIVHLRGTITGPSGSAAFTLPTGYRPSASLFATTASNDPDETAGDLVITADGAVEPSCNGGSTCIFGLDSVTFRAE